MQEGLMVEGNSQFREATFVLPQHAIIFEEGSTELLLLFKISMERWIIWPRHLSSTLRFKCTDALIDS